MTKEKVSSKSTNNDIVKALITIVQNFHNIPSPSGNGDDVYIPTIDASNLVQKISVILNQHQRQQDRLRDIMESMRRVTGA